MALDVVGRMLRMEAVQKEVIERVEQTLRTEFMSNLSQTRRRDAHEVMAEISTISTARPRPASSLRWRKTTASPPNASRR